MISVPTWLLQTDILSFLGVLRFCLLGPMSLSFSCHCIHCTNHRHEHSQENESHTLIGLFPKGMYVGLKQAAWGQEALREVSGHFAPWSFRPQSFRPNEKSLRSIIEVTSHHTRVTSLHTEVTLLHDII